MIRDQITFPPSPGSPARPDRTAASGGAALHCALPPSPARWRARIRTRRWSRGSSRRFLSIRGGRAIEAAWVKPLAERVDRRHDDYASQPGEDAAHELLA